MSRLKPPPPLSPSSPQSVITWQLYEQDMTEMHRLNNCLSRATRNLLGAAALSGLTMAGYKRLYKQSTLIGAVFSAAGAFIFGGCVGWNVWGIPCQRSFLLSEGRMADKARDNIRRVCDNHPRIIQWEQMHSNNSKHIQEQSQQWPGSGTSEG